MRRYFKNVKKPRWYTLIIAAIIYIWQCSAMIPAMRAFGYEYVIIIAAQLAVGVANIFAYLILQKDKKDKYIVLRAIVSLALGTATTMLLWDEPFKLLFGIFGVFGGVIICLSNAIILFVMYSMIKSLFQKEKIEVLYLAEPNMSFEKEYTDMMEEWNSHGGRLNPSALQNNGNDYEKWLERLKEDKEIDSLDRVPQSLFFLIRNHDRKILGAISIRHKLNDSLLKTGGHIGYGIRPSERKKGYATMMLAHALKRVKELSVEKVLITCDKDNIASEKVIINNGGVFKDEVTEDDGNVVKRYWVDKTINKAQ